MPHLPEAHSIPLDAGTLPLHVRVRARAIGWAGLLFLVLPARRRASVNALFVARILTREGALWLSRSGLCEDSRSRLQRMVREDRVTDLAVVPDDGFAVSIARPPRGDCPEVHVDTLLRVVREVRVSPDGGEVELARYFLSDFGERLNPVRFTDGDEPSGIGP